MATRHAVGDLVLVEALAAEAAVKAFDEAILHRLAQRDVVPFDVVVLLPLQDRARGQLGAVVTDDHERPAAKDNECVIERGVVHKRQALAGEVVDRDQHPEPPAIGELIGGEVKALALARPLWQGHRRPCPERALAPATPAHRQPFLPGFDGTASCGSARCFPDSTEYKRANNQTADADLPGSSVDPESQCHQSAVRHSDRSSGRVRSDRMPETENSSSPRLSSSRRLLRDSGFRSFSERLAQRGSVQHGLRQQLLELAVLVVERLQPPRVGHLHPQSDCPSYKRSHR